MSASAKPTGGLKRLPQLLSAYRWPLYLVSLLGMSIVAQGVLVYVATRPDAPRPLDNYYDRAQQWDADEALLGASKQLGWTVQLEIPGGVEYAVAALRPVDLKVRDREGQPVTGLVGQLLAARPSDNRVRASSALTELPHAPGHYRTLARLPAAGLWELNLDLRRGEQRFVHRARVEIAAEVAP